MGVAFGSGTAAQHIRCGGVYPNATVAVVGSADQLWLAPVNGGVLSELCGGVLSVRACDLRSGGECLAACGGADSLVGGFDRNWPIRTAVG